MAFKTKYVFVVVMVVVVVFLVLMEQASDYGTGYGQIFGEAASYKIQNRKVVIALETKEETSTKYVHGSTGSTSAGNDAGKPVDWELRKVPSGPDPLHHNGGSPKKPRTP